MSIDAKDAEIERLKAAMRAARLAIESAPHAGRSVRNEDVCALGLTRSPYPCNCWRGRALAALVEDAP